MSDEFQSEPDHTLPAKLVPPRYSTAAYGGGLRIRCPQCRCTVDVRADDSLTNISCESCGSRFNLVDEEGSDPSGPQTIAHFELLEQLGRGAFGAVWKARDTQLDREVAVKIPRQNQLPPAEAEMFLREARAAAQLQHPHIVRVHEVGRDGDTVYIVSELIHGETLSRWLASHRPTPIEAAELCIKIAAALAHAHDKGIIHRDLKPHNIMLDDEGAPHLMDFGLARRDAGELTVTIDGQIMGTPAYMSPEQARGQAHQADRRTDIYSLGVVLFQLLTGELPFRGDVRMLIEQVLRDEPPSPRKLSATVPRDLETICLKCLEKEPDKRYTTAHELHDDLTHFLRSEPIAARPVTRMERGWRWCRRNPKVAILTSLVATLLVLASIGATTAAVLQNRAQERILSEQRRADQELSDRQQLLKTEDAAAFAMLKEQIRAERFVEALRNLSVSESRLQGADVLDDRRAAWQRLHQIVDFYRANDEAWNQWGEENYAGVMTSAQSALQSIYALDNPTWWTSLPTKDLDVDERQRLEQEAHRLQMLHSAVQTVLGSVLAERVAAGEAIDPAHAIRQFQSALGPLQQAQSWEMSHAGAISIASNIMEQLNRELLTRLGQSGGQRFYPDCEVKLSPADNYFLGLMFFVVERSASDQNPLYAALFRDDGLESPQADTPVHSRESRSPGLLAVFLAQELAKNQIPIAEDSLATSEQRLLIAAGRERRYWPNFALGRTLFFRGKFSEAELAFNTCASLRPEYARSFEQRALMRALRAIHMTDRDQLESWQALAREDSDRAISLALEAGDPSTWWPRGDLLALLGQSGDAIAAYTRALEWEDDIRQKVNRRNNLAVVTRLAESILSEESQPPQLLADAAAVMALATIATGDSSEWRTRAESQIARALEFVPNHPHALTARGMLALNAAEMEAEVSGAASAEKIRHARSDFEQALVAVPDNYLAARGRAVACERLADWPGALSAWTYLLAPRPHESDGFATVAVTRSQRQKAEEGRERAKEKTLPNTKLSDNELRD